MMTTDTRYDPPGFIPPSQRIERRLAAIEERLGMTNPFGFPTPNPYREQVERLKDALHDTGETYATAFMKAHPLEAHATPDPEPIAASPEQRLLVMAKALLDHGDAPPSWLAAFDLARAVIDLHGRGLSHPLKTGAS